MTALLIAILFLILSVGCFVLGGKEWKTTGNPWYPMLIFFSMISMLIAGYVIRMQCLELFGI